MVDNSHKFEDVEKLWIQKIITTTAMAFEANDVPAHVQCAALMLMASDICVQSNDSDEYIIGQFRQCLQQSRLLLKSRSN